MDKHLLILPGGRGIYSGTPGQAAIQSVTLTRCVNAGQELTIGSACASMLEVTLIDPAGDLSIQPGQEVVLYRVAEDGSRQQAGVFLPETPQRSSVNTLKFTAYDRMVRLDKDLTRWVKSLTGWPYSLMTFAGMVCDACGVVFAPEAVPNGNYQIEKFSLDGVTGRQLMQWLGQVCCRYTYADPAGKIRMGWYKPLTAAAIGPREDTFHIVKRDTAPVLASEDVADTFENGELSLDSARFSVTDDGEGNVILTVDEPVAGSYYLQNGLQLDSYVTAPIDGVQIAFSSDGNSWRWPERAEGDNCYVIHGNPFLAATTQTVANALETIRAQLARFSYTPCRVSVPAGVNINVGDIVRLRDPGGNDRIICVMQKITRGQLDTLVCVGSPRRDNTVTVSNDSDRRLLEQNLQRQEQKLQRQELLRRLTEDGVDDAIYLQDGKLAIKATAILTGILQGIEIIGEEGRIGGLTITDHSLSTTYRRDFSYLTANDADRAGEIYRNKLTPSAEELYRLDVNMNGRVDSGDAVVISGMVAGNIPNYTEGRIIIDAKDPLKCVVAEVTGGYRAGEKTVLGMGRVESNAFACGGKDGYTGSFQAGGQTFQVAGGIIVKE